MDGNVLIPVSMFAMIFGCVYVGVTSRHRQRMAMIEKGMDPSILGVGRERYNTLKLGMLAMGVGLGFLLGYLLERVMPPAVDPYDPNPDNPVPYAICILLCGGAALIGHHLIIRNKA